MIKSPFGIKNILIFISMIVISFFLSIIFTVFFIEIFRSVAKMDIALIICCIMISITPGYFLVWAMCKARAQVIPKYFKCMDAVRTHIGFKDLKRILLEEEFHHIEFNDDLKVKFKNSRVRKRECDIYISQNFIYVKGVYIPKNMIVSIDTYTHRPTTNVYFHGVNSMQWEVGYFKKANTDLIRYFNKGTQIPTLKNSTYKKEKLKKYFKEEVKTKKDFMTFCELN